MTGGGSSRRRNSAGCCAGAGLRVTDTAGLAFDPLRGGWRIGRDLSVNYLLALAGPD